MKGSMLICMVLLVCCVCLLCQCGKGDLSRSEAKNKIGKHYPEKVTHPIPLYASVNHPDPSVAENERNRFMSRIGSLHTSGYLEANCISDSHMDSRGSRWYSTQCKAVLTDKIKPFVRKTTNDRAVLEVGQLVLADITGITGDKSGLGSSLRMVEYTTKVVPNDVGKSLNLKESRDRRTVMFQLYDDGWRLSQ